MNSVTSSHNPVIKEVKSLKQRKYREDKKLFFIEGIRFVEEALKENTEIVRILVSDRLTAGHGGAEFLDKVQGGGFEVFMLPDALFREVSDTENPQGVLAVVKARDYSLEEVLQNTDFLVLLDSIQDPGNMGTIIRTADAAGAGGIIVSKGCVDLYNPKVLRSTMGSIFHMPVCCGEDPVEAVKALKRKGVKVCAAHLDGSQSFYELDMKGPVALIIGNEANGISDEVARQADVLVRIPMPGRAESLNASVAAGLLMYEVVRQRMELRDR